MTLEKYTLGVGDRFGRQGVAQLRAFQLAAERGATLVPVWNKSNREHLIVGTKPQDTRRAADEAVRKTGWTGGHHVDADHIGIKTVEGFLDCSDFFTIDVADFLGKPAPEAEVEAFVREMKPFVGTLAIPGLERPFTVTEDAVRSIGQRYLLAVREAGRVYRRIAEAKGEDGFIAEVSVDEAETPQTPIELFFLLAALSLEKVRIQTIAPKFSGKFLKGIDYVGRKEDFAREFDDDILVIAHAVRSFDLPSNLKLSVHSGSDKFSIYSSIGEAVRRRKAGLHLKTAGTTWLEEVGGLAESGGKGLEIARAIYARAFERIDELCAPYLAVVEIDRSKLPSPKTVSGWGPVEFASALRHVESSPGYNPDLRQLLHVGYKVAAEMGDLYFEALDHASAVVGANVSRNLWERHIVPLFF